MRAREYLSRVRLIDRQIENRVEERARLEDTLTRGTKNLTGMPRGGNTDWTEAAARVADLDALIARDISRLCQVKAEVWAMIDRVEPAEERTLLELRFRCGYSWRVVAREMNYTERQIYRLYKSALRAVDKLLSQ